jgi:hypothetical protein
MTNTPLEPLPEEPVDENEPVNPPVTDDDEPLDPRRAGDDQPAQEREPDPGAIPPESTSG